MSQNDFVIANADGATYRADVNSALQALASTSLGTTAPTTKYQGQQWIDSSGSPWVLKLWDGADWIEIGEIDTAANTFRPRLARGHIAGLGLTNNAVDADHDIDIAVGEARDATDATDMSLSSTLTKRIDAAWAVGSGAGGMDTGTVANDTVYAVWLIKRTDTGVVDALFSTSFASPTMPTSYDRKRLIGAVVTDGAANIIAFTQVGDYFRFTGDVLSDVLDSTITSQAFEIAALSVPPDSIAHVYGYLENTTGTSGSGFLVIRTNGAADDALGYENWARVETGSTFDVVSGIGQVLVDGSSQVQYAAIEADGAATVRIRTLGFWMPKRSDP